MIKEIVDEYFLYNKTEILNNWIYNYMLNCMPLYLQQFYNFDIYNVENYKKFYLPFIIEEYGGMEKAIDELKISKIYSHTNHKIFNIIFSIIQVSILNDERCMTEVEILDYYINNKIDDIDDFCNRFIDGFFARLTKIYKYIIHNKRVLDTLEEWKKNYFNKYNDFPCEYNINKFVLHFWIKNLIISYYPP